MSTSMALLGLLSHGPRHGYELKRTYDLRFPQARPLAFGQVYATLSRLSRSGLIDVAAHGTQAGPERTVYDLTAAGSKELRTWIAEPLPAAPHVANEFFVKVVVAIIAGGSPRNYLAAQRAAHMARMRELTAIKTDPDATTATVLSADFALSHLDADLTWMDTTMRRLDALTLEVQQ